MRAGGELGGGQEGECARARLPCRVLVYRKAYVWALEDLI
jgi:hypothetical protein